VVLPAAWAAAWIDGVKMSEATAAGFAFTASNTTAFTGSESADQEASKAS
jgi:hypothetical protein